MDRIMYTPWTLGFCGHPHVLVSVSFLQFGETLTLELNDFVIFGR